MSVPFDYTIGKPFPYSQDKICTIENAEDEVRTEWEEQNVNGSDSYIKTHKYYNDWELLMKVVEKIETLGFDVTICTCICTISDPAEDKFEEINVFWDNSKIKATYGAVTEFIKLHNNDYKKYPFNEGDDYWTIVSGKINWSCWDSVSEELHDENPNKVYYKTEEDALESLINS